MGIIKKYRTATLLTLIIAFLSAIPYTYAQITVRIDPNDLSQIENNLTQNRANPEASQQLIESVTNGKISPDLAKAISTIQNLGNISNLSELIQQITNQAVTSTLRKMLQKTDGAQQVLNVLPQISSIAGTKDTIRQVGSQAIAQALAQQLQQVAPQLSKALANLTGGEDELIKALSNILSSNNTNIGQNISESGPSCSGGCPACKNCPRNINANHQRIRSHVISEFEQHRNWLVTSYFLDYITPAMMLMTEQLVTTGMHQVKIIGKFFDAKHQLETQRLLQQMSAKAHKDYHPSESMCKIGTNMRSLAPSEKRVGLIHQGLSQGMIQRQLLSGKNVSGTEGQESDRRSRGNLLINKFCNKRDAGTDIEGKTALDQLCKNNGGLQTNMDVDFISAIENKLTLELNFANDANGPATPDEENVFALGSNIFGHEVLPYISKTKLRKNSSVNDYLNFRSITAKRSVAQNSYSAITAMRSEGDTEVAPFLKAILKEAGVEELNIEKRLGEKPSYFAQMEVLTKDIYQNPEFYSNLYDKPANVERKSAALLAIEIMQDRDIYKSLLRSEAVLATLVEVMLSNEHQRVTENLDNVDSEGETVEQSGGGS